jgi:hypothetical protein
MNIFIMSLKYQIPFTVKRIQLSDTDVSKHYKIASGISQVPSRLPLAGECDHTTSVPRK